MPEKGFITQCFCVLLDSAPTLDAIKEVLADYTIHGTVDAQKEWAFGGPSVMVAYRPEVSGNVAIDVVDKQWPDEMGDTQTDSILFGAWSMGQFGPGTFPGALTRAGEQSWAWPEAAETVKDHRAFVRVRSSYAWGKDADASLIPADYSAFEEMIFLTNLVGKLLSLPGALAFFNPNGEVLRNDDIFTDIVGWSAENKLPPLELWSNIRLFRANPDWLLMDTVGNTQLDLPDFEACFKDNDYECQDIDTFLRTLTLRILWKGDDLKTGDVVDGPGGKSWLIERRENAFINPPRDIIRLTPKDGTQVPPELLEPTE